MKHKWVSEWEISNRKHGRFISRFEHTCSTSPPSTLWRISTKNNPSRSLGAATLSTSFLKNSWTRKSLTYSYKNNTHKQTSLPRSHLYTSLKNLSQREPTSSPPQIQEYKLGDLYTLIIKNNSHNQSSYRIDMVMESSSLCEKNLDRFGGGKLKKAFDKIKRFTLEKLLLIWKWKL